MSEEPEQTTETTADPDDISYELPNLARTGEEATEDGQAPGATAETATEGEDGKTEDERASEAGTELAGRKRTLKADLDKERTARRDAERQLEEQARLIESWRPILEKLNGRPDLQDAVMNGTISVAQAEATKDRDDQIELKDIAEDLGYYHLKADGTPDYDRPNLERAAKYRARHQGWAKQAAATEVQPYAQQSTEQKIGTRIEQAVQYATTQGDADPEIVRQMFTEHARKNPQWVLDNESGNILYDRAVARTFREGKAPKPAPQRVTRETPDFVHTETPGGKRVAGPRLTAAEKELGAAYGLTDKDWELAEAHAGVRRGYTRLTED